MIIGKVQTKHGFEFHCFQMWEGVTWFFRPIAAELWVTFTNPEFEGKSRKPELLAFLNDTQKAQGYYDARVAHMADVEAAEKRFDDAKKALEYFNSNAFDPGGGANNPGAVARDFRRVGDARRQVENGPKEIEEAKRIRTILDAGNRRTRT